MSRLVPDADHIARYCRPLDLDGEQLLATAFMLKKSKGETGLSTNWLEHLHSIDRGLQITRLRETFKEKGYSVAAGAKFAAINVGALKTSVREGTSNECDPIVSHLPQPKDPSHTEILGIVKEDDLVAELILQVVSFPLYSARQDS